jgi:hypothetical protein
MALNNIKSLQKLAKMKLPIIKDYFLKKTQEFDLQSKPLLINELHFFVEDVRLNKSMILSLTSAKARKR